MGAKHSHVFYGSVDGDGVVDMTPGSVVGDHEAPTFSLGGPLGYAISPDGREVAYVTNLDKVPAASTNNDIFVLQVGAEPSTAKKVSTSPGSDDGPAYSPDGKWLAWRSQARNGFESDKFGLVMLNRDNGKIANLTKNFDGWVDEFVWQKLDRIYFTSPREGHEWIFARNLMGQHADEPSAIANDAEYSSLNVTADDRQVVAVKMTVDRPAEIAIIGTVSDGGASHLLTHANQALIEKLELSALTSFWFTGAAATKVEGFLVKPPNFDSRQEIPREVPHARWPADRVG